MSGPIRILIADDHPLFRAGLRSLLESVPDTEVVGEATTGLALDRMLVELRSDCEQLAAHPDTRRGPQPEPQVDIAPTATHTITPHIVVQDAERAVAFYRDAFGMDVPALPASGERPYNAANPRLFDMFDIAGAKERHQSARVQSVSVSVELMEIQNVEHQTIPMRPQDPGTATLVFIVRDLDVALARVRQANAAVKKGKK